MTWRDKPIIHYVDIETFGLDPAIHPIWEIAVVEDAEPVPDLTDLDPVVTSFFFDMTTDEMAVADAGALRMTRYYEREQEERDKYLRTMGTFMKSIKEVRGNHHFISSNGRGLAADWLAKNLTGWLAGNAVHFDEVRLSRFIKEHKMVPIWNHHLLDVETYAAGVLGLSPPWKASEISDGLGVPRPQGQHSARVDAQWSRNLHRVALARGEVKSAL